MHTVVSATSVLKPEQEFGQHNPVTYFLNREQSGQSGKIL